MNILFVGSNPKSAGGIETFGRNLKKIFPKEIEFFSVYQTSKLYEVEDVIELFPKNLLYRIFNKITNYYMVNIEINKIFEKKKYEIVIINNPRHLRYIDKKKYKGKIILVQHQTARTFWTRKGYLGRDTNLLNEMKERVDKLITLSPMDCDEFIEKFSLSREKVAYIRHMSCVETLRNKKLINKNMISICRIDNKHKRLDLAIKAMKKLTDFNLNIYGDGPDKLELENLVKDLKLKNVFFHGKTDKVIEKLDSSFLHVMTSDFEGYPLSNIEAAKRGLPLIIRNTFTSSKDMIKGNGILLEKEWNEDKFVEAVKIIYSNYEIYSENSKKIGERHNLEKNKKKWHEIFLEVLSIGEKW